MMRKSKNAYRRLSTNSDEEKDVANLLSDSNGRVQSSHDREDSLSSHSGNDVELRSRNERKKERGTLARADYILIDRKLKDGETLQKICLQYSVSQAELKRVNNLVSDQDFYALSFIKIPVKPYSHAELTLLTEGGPDVDDTAPYLPIELDNNTGSSNSWMIPPPRSRSESPTSINSDDHQKKFEKMLKKVDSSVEKAKQAAELRDNGIFSASDGDTRHFFPATSSSLSHFMERSLCHYIVLVLCVFIIIIIPIGVLVYKETDQQVKEG